MVIERLLRWRFCMSNPWRGPLMPSLGSTPGGDSILITSAPKSANCFTQVGPARTRERSRMRKRESAVEAGICGMGLSGGWRRVKKISVYQHTHIPDPERVNDFETPG